MKYRTMKIVIILLCIISLIFYTNNTFAVDIDFKVLNGHIEDDTLNNTVGNVEKYFIALLITLLQIFTVSAIMYSIYQIIRIGIKYILAAPGGKAKYKERLIPYLIGTFLLFGAVGITRTIYQLIENMF